MPKPSKQIIIDEIVKYIEKGNSTAKICTVICNKFQFSQRTFYNHYKKAEEKHIAKQQAINEKTEALDIQNAIDAREELLITKERLAKGLVSIFDNETANVKPADQIAAAKQLAVMYGLNEPSKTDVSISGEVKNIIQLFEDQEPLVE